MKLQIIQTIKKGLEIITKNSIILTLIIIKAVLGCINYYFFIYSPGLAGITPGADIALPELPAHFGLYAILLILISMFLTLVITKMVYDAVKNNISIPKAINLSAKKFIFILIASILYFLILLIGFVALIIPGIFLWIKFIFVTYFILLNNEKIINSFRKSWQITKGSWWRILGLSLMLLIPIITLSIVVRTIALDSIQTALSLHFLGSLLSGWMLSALTIAYIQLTTQTPNKINNNKKGRR